MDVGFIGLGAMGSAMAANLIKAGHRLKVWNRSPEPAEALAKEGAERVDDPAQAFEADAVVTMLANDEAIRDVIVDPGLLDRARKGLVHVVSSTISLDLAKALERAHAERGLGYVAAPVLGRPDVAEGGELNVLAAGAPEALAKVQPLLDAFGKKTWPMGREAHKANVAKLAVNFMLASAIETMAEAFTLGEKHGVEPQGLFELVTGTLFAAPAYKTYGGFIVNRQFEPAKFKLTLGLKDVRLAIAAGEAGGAPLPFASVMRDNFVDAIANGDAEKDWAALARVSMRRAGLNES